MHTVTIMVHSKRENMHTVTIRVHSNKECMHTVMIVMATNVYVKTRQMSQI